MKTNDGVEVKVGSILAWDDYQYGVSAVHSHSVIALVGWKAGKFPGMNYVPFIGFTELSEYQVSQCTAYRGECMQWAMPPIRPEQCDDIVSECKTYGKNALMQENKQLRERCKKLQHTAEKNEKEIRDLVDQVTGLTKCSEEAERWEKEARKQEERAKKAEKGLDEKSVQMNEWFEILASERRSVDKWFNKYQRAKSLLPDGVVVPSVPDDVEEISSITIISKGK